MSTEHYKAALLLALAQVETDLQSIATKDEETGDWVAVPDATELNEADINSEADGVEEWNERRATTASLELMYQNTKRALSKIDAGTYGTCEICSQPIESERLEVIPTARTCKAHRDEERTLSL